MAVERYHIMDEPRPHRLAHLSVDPLWVFLSMMLGGAWIGWPWWIVNGLVMGSASLRKEATIVVLGIMTSMLVAAAYLYYRFAGVIPDGFTPYMMILLPGLKLGFAYPLHIMQARTFELYSHFGGESRKGLWVLIGAFAMRIAILTQLSSNYWALVLA